MKNGLWASPTEFKNFAAVDKTTSLSSEIATRQRSIDFYSLGMALPNPDPILKKMGKDVAVYKELLSDGHVRGCVTNRKAGVKKLNWSIDRGKAKSRHAKTLESVYKDLDVDRIMGEMLNASQFGMQPLEVLWNTGGAFYAPRDVVGKPQQWFVFDEHNELRFITKENMLLGEKLPPRSFLLARNEPTYENPYGFPVLSCCFWPVTFKKGGMKFWVTFTEKFGMPFVIGKHPRGIDQSEIDQIASMLERMVQDAIAVIPDDGSVEILENKGTASADLYAKLIQACKDDISTAQLGHTGSSQSTPGKLGSEDQAGEVRDNIVGDDKKIVEREFNVLNRWILEMNYAEQIAAVPEFILYEEEDVDLDQATRDKTLADAGVVLSADYYQRAYGFEDGDVVSVGRAALPVNPQSAEGMAQSGKLPAQFSAPEKKSIAQKIGDVFMSFMSGSKNTPDGQAAIDTAAQGIDPADLQAQMEGVLKPVIDLINSGSSYENIMKNLATAFPNMDATALEEMLSRAIFVTEAWGMIQAAEGK
jgi:phage gp29-like protein